MQAFRRDKNEAPIQRSHLSGLAPTATHQITDLDAGTPRRMTGKELMGEGLALAITPKPGAAVVLYRQTR